MEEAGSPSLADVKPSRSAELDGGARPFVWGLGDFGGVIGRSDASCEGVVSIMGVSVFSVAVGFSEGGFEDLGVFLIYFFSGIHYH